MLCPTTLDEANLKDYGCELTKIPLLCDNENASKMANNPINHSGTKHIDIWHHFLRDHEAKGDIAIHYVSTKKQLADIFTKPLDESRFCAFWICSLLMSCTYFV
jgi:hypothetical protein